MFARVFRWAVSRRLIGLAAFVQLFAAQSAHVTPTTSWTTQTPEQVELDRTKLDELARLVGGRGCVVRHGMLAYEWGDPTLSSDIASAVKPVLSTLLMFAVQEGRLKSVDDAVAEFEPRLRELNQGKDATITWRHLASQTSGYGLVEKPGQAYAYNDFALALYYDTLMQKVFRDEGVNVLKTRLGDVLQFQDPIRFDRPRLGRLSISCRDLARFGLFIMRGGNWNGRQLLRPDLVRTLLDSPLASSVTVTSGQEAPMLPEQRSLGGGKNITPIGPGYYSFNWWLNRADRDGRRLFVEAPPDTLVASGHGGKRTLWILPSLALIVTWNDSVIDDHDRSPSEPGTKCNQAAKLMRAAAR